MNRLVLALAIVMAFGLVTVAAAPGVSASTAMPSWSAGDYWLYTVTGTGGGVSGLPALGSGATIRFDVVGTDSTTINGTAVPTYHTKLNYTFAVPISPGHTQNISLNGDAWYRQSDLALAKLSLGTTAMGLTISITITYSPPPAIQWPLTPGTSWSVGSNVSATLDLFGNTNSTSMIVSLEESVQSDTNLTVPAGTFQVTPLRQETAGFALTYTTQYWSSSVGNYASERTYYANNNTQTSSVDLKSYSYGAGAGLSFLGLPVLAWIIIVVVIVVAVAAVLLLRRKKPAAPMGLPPTTPPGMTPMPGQPPQQPPQGPPGAPPQP